MSPIYTFLAYGALLGGLAWPTRSGPASWAERRR